MSTKLEGLEFTVQCRRGDVIIRATDPELFKVYEGAVKDSQIPVCLEDKFKKFVLDGLNRVPPVESTITRSGTTVIVDIQVCSYIDTIKTRFVLEDVTNKCDIVDMMRRELAQNRAEIAELRAAVAEFRQFMPWLRESAQFVPGYSSLAVGKHTSLIHTGVPVDCNHIGISGNQIIVDGMITNISEPAKLFSLLSGFNPVKVAAVPETPWPARRACDYLTDFVNEHAGAAKWTNLESITFCSGVVELGALAGLPKLTEIVVDSAGDVSVLAGSTVRILRYRDKVRNGAALDNTRTVLLKC